MTPGTFSRFACSSQVKAEAQWVHEGYDERTADMGVDSSSSANLYKRDAGAVNRAELGGTRGIVKLSTTPLDFQPPSFISSDLTHTREYDRRISGSRIDYQMLPKTYDLLKKRAPSQSAIFEQGTMIHIQFLKAPTI